MKNLVLIGLAAAGAMIGTAAQAIPVALHYDAKGSTGVYGPSGNVDFSFDLYYDPSLLGTVAANGGTATNGHFSFNTGYPTPYGTADASAGADLPNVSASISLLAPIRYPFAQNLRLLTVGAIGLNTSAYTGIYINLDGTFAFMDYSNGVSVVSNGVRYISENQIVSTSAVPEAATWAMMMVGLGVVGGSLRRRRNVMTRVAFA